MPRHAAALLALVAAAAACQNYRFEGVKQVEVTVVGQPYTLAPKPASVMIVQDLSGSMCEPIQLTDPNTNASCLATTGSGAGYCSACSSGACSDPASCDSKMQLVVQKMDLVLNDLAPKPGQINLGLASFGAAGEADQCATGSIDVPIGDAVTTIPQIEGYYANAVPNGGTPTAATLQVAAADPFLQNPETSQRILVLITDGFPNCAADQQTTACLTAKWPDGNAYGCASAAMVPLVGGQPQTPPAACGCSFGACANPNASTEDCCPQALNQNAAACVGQNDCESWFCLDDQGTESVIASLHEQGIETLVVGLGYDTNSNPTVLDAMAAAGQGNPTATAFTAKNPQGLVTALEQVLSPPASCKYTITPAPESAGLITVTLDGRELQPGDPDGFTYTPSSDTLTLNGTACAVVEDGGTGNLDITAIAQ
jgi:hypothetical protein